jgi:hypothetical protein
MTTESTHKVESTDKSKAETLKTKEGRLKELKKNIEL